MKFEFIKNSDGSSLDYSTKSIQVQKTITVNVKQPLWEAIGKHVSFQKLTELGLKIQYTPDQTKDRINYQKITFMYQNITEFPTRVTQLKAKYDFLGVAYNATVADITAALNAKFDNVQEKATWLAEFNSLLDKGVKLNYQAGMKLYCGYTEQDLDPVDDFVMWTDFPILVKWLPGTFEQSEIPARRQPQFVTSFERQNEINAQILADAAEEEAETDQE